MKTRTESQALRLSSQLTGDHDLCTPSAAAVPPRRTNTANLRPITAIFVPPCSTCQYQASSACQWHLLMWCVAQHLVLFHHASCVLHVLFAAKPTIILQWPQALQPPKKFRNFVTFSFLLCGSHSHFAHIRWRESLVDNRKWHPGSCYAVQWNESRCWTIHLWAHSPKVTLAVYTICICSTRIPPKPCANSSTWKVQRAQYVGKPKLKKNDPRPLIEWWWRYLLWSTSWATGIQIKPQWH